jgi:AcrR family transcriptional regulator
MMTTEDNSVNIEKPAGAYHHGDLRAALVDAGMALLEQRRSDDLSLREVARSAGVSATAVYRHFPDKDALMRAIAARGFGMMGAMQAKAALGHPGPGAFAATGTAYVKFALKHPAVFRLMFSCAPPRDPFSMPDSGQPAPLQMLRANAASLTPPGASDEARKIIAVRAWALVHGLAVLMLDQMVEADDALIAAVIEAAQIA